MGYTTRRRLRMRPTEIEISRSAQKAIDDNNIDVAELEANDQGKITLREVKAYLKTQAKVVPLGQPKEETPKEPIANDTAGDPQPGTTESLAPDAPEEKI